jgi:hypothetical protein
MAILQTKSRVCDIHQDRPARGYGQIMKNATMTLSGMPQYAYTLIDMCKECFGIYELLIKLKILNLPVIVCDICHETEEMHIDIFSDFQREVDPRFSVPEQKKLLVCAKCSKNMHDRISKVPNGQYLSSLIDCRGQLIYGNATVMYEYALKRFEEEVSKNAQE